VCEAISAGGDILALARGLLLVCRDEVDELVRADNDQRTWRARDRLRRRADAAFAAIDDEEIDPRERAGLADLAREAADDLPPVMIARTLAESLDAVLGSRLLPMFLGRTHKLKPDDPIPTPHPDWRRLTPSPSSDPWALDGRLDALPHLRLAGAWAREVEVTLDGDWRTWHALPQLQAGDRLACAVPNETLAEFHIGRGTVEGRPVFFDVRPAGGEAEQTARCLELLELAAAHDCRVVVFPELSVPRATVDAMGKWLGAQDRVELVVAGSRHRKARRGGWHNESQILFAGWRERRHHRKFRAFSFHDSDGEARVKRAEHLAAAPARVRAFLSPSWTLVVLVCKDLVVEPVPRLLAELRANLVLVPALTFKMDAFRTAAADVATWAQGVALVANAALAQRPRGARSEVVVALPSQEISLYAEIPPARSILVATLGNPERMPQVAAVTPVAVSKTSIS
jgi:predicted amidohydrolase